MWVSDAISHQMSDLRASDVFVQSCFRCTQFLTLAQYIFSSKMWYFCSPTEKNRGPKSAVAWCKSNTRTEINFSQKKSHSQIWQRSHTCVHSLNVLDLCRIQSDSSGNKSECLDETYTEELVILVELFSWYMEIKKKYIPYDVNLL